ncbi:MAG TPA: trehalase family glycosidase, partial [Trinickia sp.]|uniref:trehalase family glycosidase n=1 Tax=Trinickia sp. TaxID=2571163 RepID=UPI002F409554
MSLSLARRLAAASLTAILSASPVALSVCYGAQPIEASPYASAVARQSPPIAASQVNPHAQPSPVEPASPFALYGELYRAVELARIFPDSKTFADMIPNAPPQQIVAEFAAQRDQPGFDLRNFVEARFSAPAGSDSHYATDPNQNVVAHIDTLWNVLRRGPDRVESRWSSLLALPQPYLIPGGRFDEIYYWDSYFIMLGLEQSGRHDLAKEELKNFATLIDRYGH